MRFNGYWDTYVASCDALISTFSSNFYLTSELYGPFVGLDGGIFILCFRQFFVLTEGKAIASKPRWPRIKSVRSFTLLACLVYLALERPFETVCDSYRIRSTSWPI